MKNPILFLALCFSLSVQAQTISYNAAAVPEALKNKASVIVHLERIEVDVESLDKATMKVKKIFTVLNEDGKSALAFHEYSTRYLSLEEAEIKVYDQKGKQTARFKKRDMTTVAVGEGLVEDGYVTYYEISTTSYPVTIEFDYEQKFKSTLFFPDFRFIQSKEAVIESSYTARVPSDIPIRYKAKHCSVTPTITEDGKYKLFTWKVNDLPACQDEEGSVSAQDKFPYVSIVADQFSHYGYLGDLSSWKSFGTWIGELYKGLDELPAERQAFFRQLVTDAPTEKEKARRIYKYLQENFRYVSIQLGIGGLKPFSASFTDQKKYGDCKALSNYMKAALKSVGVKSYVAIINAQYNEEPVDPDFPANNFNHVILCIPEPKDSIWLECTSSTTEFGQLGTFTENRNALLITEDGGVLVSTPSSDPSSNFFCTRTTVNIASDLSAITETTMTTKGEFSEIMMDMLKDKKDDQKRGIVFYLGYKQPDDFEFSEKRAEDKHQLQLKMVIRKLPEFNSGDKYFISQRINKLWAGKLPSAANRKMDFYFPFPFEKRDTTVMKLCAGLKPDVLPKDKEIKNAYGYYQSRSWYNANENAIYTATSFILKKHKVLAGDYPSVRSFFDEVIQDDAQKIVVNKTENSSAEKKTF